MATHGCIVARVPWLDQPRSHPRRLWRRAWSLWTRRRRRGESALTIAPATTTVACSAKSVEAWVVGCNHRFAPSTMSSIKESACSRGSLTWVGGQGKVTVERANELVVNQAPTPKTQEHAPR